MAQQEGYRRTHCTRLWYSRSSHLSLLFLPLLAGSLHWVDDGTSNSTAGTRVFIDLYMHICMYVCMYAHMYVCMYVCTYVLRQNSVFGIIDRLELYSKTVNRLCMDRRSTTLPVAWRPGPRHRLCPSPQYYTRPHGPGA